VAEEIAHACLREAVDLESLLALPPNRLKRDVPVRTLDLPGNPEPFFAVLDEFGLDVGAVALRGRKVQNRFKQRGLALRIAALDDVHAAAGFECRGGEAAESFAGQLGEVHGKAYRYCAQCIRFRRGAVMRNTTSKSEPALMWILWCRHLACLQQFQVIRDVALGPYRVDKGLQPLVPLSREYLPHQTRSRSRTHETVKVALDAGGKPAPQPNS
jgi:hypothetical protein